MNKVENPITVIIADDHPLIRQGFVSILNDAPEIQILAVVENGAMLVAAAIALNPMVIITDIKMPGMDGMEATAIIKQKCPHIYVVLLSVFDDDTLVKEMLLLGVSGYLLKNARDKELLAAIKTVAAGGVYYCKEIEKKIEQVKQEEKQGAGQIALTQREIEILRLTAQGKSNPEIAALLCISVRTVETHRHNLYRKTGMNNPVTLALYAQKHGYLDDTKTKQP
ncbi:MAG: response regulator [Flavisolibacter sp.]|jgi:DNA-binding NarL/FixJ family response regulator